MSIWRAVAAISVTSGLFAAGVSIQAALGLLTAGSLPGGGERSPSIIGISLLVLGLIAFAALTQIIAALRRKDSVGIVISSAPPLAVIVALVVMHFSDALTLILVLIPGLLTLASSVSVAWWLSVGKPRQVSHS